MLCEVRPLERAQVLLDVRIQARRDAQATDQELRRKGEVRVVPFGRARHHAVGPTRHEGRTVKERPILFSGPMVRAILAGTKTQTRRVVKPQPPTGHVMAWLTNWVGLAPGFGVVKQMSRNGVRVECPHGQPGDRLWVRERFAFGTQPEQVFYLAARLEGHSDTLTWKPSIYMPRWASRLTLELTQVRVERLQDISEEDVKAEGMAHDFAFSEGLISRLGGQRPMLVGCFAELWDDLNAKRGLGWEINPWVWALTFKGVESRTR